MLPDARYCIGCARLQSARESKKNGVGRHSSGHVIGIAQLVHHEARREKAVVTPYLIPGHEPVKYAKKSSQRMPVLKDQVFDDGRATQLVLKAVEPKNRRERRKLRKRGSGLNYLDGNTVELGDVIYADAETSSVKNQLWVIDTTTNDSLNCHNEHTPSWLHSFDVHAVKLAFRRENVGIA